MRVLVATGIFEPEPGGPATYASGLAAQLKAKGHEVSILTYSDRASYDFDATLGYTVVRVVRSPGLLGKVLNRVKYFFAAWKPARGADIVYSLDWFAAGVPVALVCKIKRLPLIVRVGGDYAWEQLYLQSGEPPIPLSDFYSRGIYKQGRYAAAYRVVKYVLSSAHTVIFNSDRQRDIYREHFALPAERTSVIYNPRPTEAAAAVLRDSVSHEIVFWGRFIVMKNIGTLLRAFSKAALPESYHLTLIGDGPERVHLYELVRDLKLNQRVTILHGLRQKDAWERVKNARAFVLPSWTDISPMQVYESLALKIPALVTKENYLPIRDQLPEMIDPASVDDIAQKLSLLADDQRYADFARRFESIRFDHTWPALADEHLALFSSIADKGASDGVVMQVGADRSARGILHKGTPAYERQKAYAQKFGRLDILAFSRKADAAGAIDEGPLHLYPTDSSSPFLYVFDALRIAKKAPVPRVVSAQDPFEAGLTGYLLSRRYGVPLHIQVHTDLLSPSFSGLSLLNRARVLIAGFLLKRASRIRVVSEPVRKHIVARYHLKTPVTVLPIYTDVQRFKSASAPEELKERYKAYSKKILVVARLEPEKNVALALRAFAESAPKDACLIIAGEGSEKGKLLLLAHHLRIGERVFLVSPDDIAPYYALANLVLVTSRYEGYGLVILEALAAGKPVLSTDVGIAKESGVLVATPDSYAAALKEWFDKGPYSMHLQSYPYENFDEYVGKYCDDIQASISLQK